MDTEEIMRNMEAMLHLIYLGTLQTEQLNGQQWVLNNRLSRISSEVRRKYGKAK